MKVKQVKIIFFNVNMVWRKGEVKSLTAFCHQKTLRGTLFWSFLTGKLTWIKETHSSKSRKTFDINKCLNFLNDNISCWRGVFKHKRLPQRTRLSGGKNSGKVPQAYVTWFHHSWISSFFFLFFSFFFFGGGGGLCFLKKTHIYSSQWNFLTPLWKGIKQTLPQKVLYEDWFISPDWLKNRFHKVVKSPHGQGYYAVFSFYNEGIVRISYNYFHFYFPCTRGS